MVKKLFLFLVYVLVAFTTPLRAQTVASVVDGDWSNPTTWDCNCVPGFTSAVTVAHHVTSSTTVNGYTSIVVSPAGHLELSGGGSLWATQCVVQGIVSCPIYLGLGPMTLSGIVNASGIYLWGDLHMQGGTVSTPGNFTSGTGFAVDGFGSICAGDSTHLQGPLTGTVDICDLSPTVSDPPFIDEGAQFVGPNVTFCQNSTCSTGLQQRSCKDAVHVFPLPAAEQFTIDVQRGSLQQIDLFDAQGRITKATGPLEASSFAVIDVSDLREGAYVLRLRMEDGMRTLPLIIAR